MAQLSLRNWSSAGKWMAPRQDSCRKALAGVAQLAGALSPKPKCDIFNSSWGVCKKQQSMFLCRVKISLSLEKKKAMKKWPLMRI